MKEAPFEIRDALKAGLRPDDRLPRGAVALVELRNLKPTDMGAVSPELLSYPITNPVFSQSWPYPQLIIGDRTLFFRDGNSLRTVNEGTWATTGVTINDVDDPTSSLALAAGGGPVHIASFSKSYFMTDGKNFIMRTPAYPNTLLFDTGRFTCDALVGFDGRLFLAGMKGSNFTFDPWLLLYDRWRESSDGQVYTASDEPIDTHYILYSDEAGGDVDTPFELLKAAIGAERTDTDLGPMFESLLIEAIEERRIGLIPCRFTGPILSLKQLGKELIVYGQRGVSVLSQNALGGYIETPLGMRGVASRGAVGGDDREHIIIDTDGDLWRLNSDGSTRLGYKEFIASLALADTIVSFDKEFREFWISDGTATYILNGFGLGGPVSLLPSSLVRSHASATLLGTSPTINYNITVTPPADLDHTDANVVLIRSAPVDLGQRGQKHVTTLHIASEGVRDGRATVHYRYDQTSSTYIRRKQDKITQDGFARIDVNLVDAMIEVLGVAPTQEAEYHYIEVRYQTDDRRHIRGIQTQSA